ncbi:MAG: membrane dipeptidase [Bacilli bacterium]|nr:membrane dipeptidase [Bacilli bacterium]
MYDMHYDLLTILYYVFEKRSLSHLYKLIGDCRDIYNKDNIIGGIINLYFMTYNEMFEELGITKEEINNIPLMLKKSIGYLKYLKDIDVIPKDVDFIYSIEGCDYLKGADDLDELYELGLRSIVPVWNNKNKFASGNRSLDGITKEGIELISKAIELGMIVDVSHANKKSFNDILDVLEKYNDYLLLASHSNVRSICDRDRNLDDEQLYRLRDMNGYISLFTNGNFLTSDNKNKSYKERQDMYLKHLDYLINKIGFSDDKLLVATDDMNFHPDKSYHNLEAFNINSVASDLFKVISKNYDDELANKIMINNPKKLINKVKRYE